MDCHAKYRTFTWLRRQCQLVRDQVSTIRIDRQSLILKVQFQGCKYRPYQLQWHRLEWQFSYSDSLLSQKGSTVTLFLGFPELPLQPIGPVTSVQKGLKASRSNLPDSRVSYSNNFGTKFHSDSWRNVQCNSMVRVLSQSLGDTETWNQHCENESRLNRTFISFSPPSHARRSLLNAAALRWSYLARWNYNFEATSQPLSTTKKVQYGLL